MEVVVEGRHGERFGVRVEEKGVDEGAVLFRYCD